MKEIDLANVDLSDPSQRTDAIQRLIDKEMKDSGCDYRTAWNRVASDPDNYELFGAMSSSDANLHTRKNFQEQTKKVQKQMDTLRSEAPSKPSGEAKMPVDSKAPPQIKTLRANGAKI